MANITDDGDWRFEGKWDGIRALATLGPNGLRLHSRAGNDFTHAYPELQELAELLDGTAASSTAKSSRWTTRGGPAFRSCNSG